MNINIHNYKNFNIETINYCNPKKIGKNSFKSILDNSDRLIFESPKMKVIELPNKNNSNLSLQFNINDKEFYDFIQFIDFFNINYIYKNSKKWFDIEYKKDVIKDFYNFFILEYKTNENNIPFIRFNISENDLNNINIYDSNKKKLNWDNIDINNEISIILEYTGLIFSKKDLLPCWNILQIKKNNGLINLTDLLDINKVKNKEKVIDDEMINELSKLPCKNITISDSNSNSNSNSNSKLSLKNSINKSSLKNSNSNFSHSNSEMSDKIIRTLNTKKKELQQILLEVEKAYMKTDELSKIAKERVEEIQSIANTFSQID